MTELSLRSIARMTWTAFWWTIAVWALWQLAKVLL